jgi:hypothetical protein
MPGRPSLISSGAASSDGPWFYGLPRIAPTGQDVVAGGVAAWRIDLPAEPGNVFFFFAGLALGSRGGLPIARSASGRVLVWPLAPDALLDLSLRIPTLWGLLDGNGQGAPFIRIPRDRSLAGVPLVTSALTFDRAGRLATITRDVASVVVW